jgi:hypothetical protein
MQLILFSKGKIPNIPKEGAMILEIRQRQVMEPLKFNEKASFTTMFVSSPSHSYYLSSIDTGHNVDSPCLNAGFPTFDLSRMITGTTRTDGLFGTFPRDLGYHGMQFNKTFREGTWLIPQDNTHSPIDVVDAAIRDINGDNVPDLIVADESGVLLYINDSEGQMVYTSGFYTATPRALGVVDLNTNGLFDIVVATTHGVRIYCPTCYSRPPGFSV